MKNLLFVFTLTLISLQVKSQMYIVSIVDPFYFDEAGCYAYEHVLITVDPTGNQTVDCFDPDLSDGALISISQHLNNIMAQGYKLISQDNGYSNGYINGLILEDTTRAGITFILAAP